MMKKITVFTVFLLFTNLIFSQVKEEVIIGNQSKQQEWVTVGNDIEDEDEEVPFGVLEEIPNFEVCKDLTNQRALFCFELNLNKHISTNLIYPKEALDANIQGKVLVRFVINKEGNIINIITKAPKGCELLEQEAKRIIEALPKFSPGKIRGKIVNVPYYQKIKFELPT